MWAPVINGIPQGSVLGTIVFTIYINDLPDVVCNVAKLFAGDTNIYSVVNNINDKENLKKELKN